jgi:hypothetical protein
LPAPPQSARLPRALARRYPVDDVMLPPDPSHTYLQMIVSPAELDQIATIRRLGGLPTKSAAIRAALAHYAGVLEAVGRSEGRDRG